MKHVIKICFLFVLTNVYSQSITKLANSEMPFLSVKDIARHTQYFTFEEEQLKGAGKRVLERIAKNSQFIIIGETHGSSQTSNFVSSWLPTLGEHGFGNFACEVGPHSAELLEQMSTPSTETFENMLSFRERYYMEELEDGTIPFFSGREDIRFLQVAAEQGMDLWGLDQEYYYSILHLTECLAYTSSDNRNHSLIIQSQKKVNKILREYFIKEDTSRNNFDAIEAILADNDVKEYFDLFAKSNVEAQSIIRAIEMSMDIYMNWQRGSHADRISYMRNNLIKNVREKYRQSGELPKVFLKFGMLHASKIHANGAYDVGHALQELSCKTGTKTTSIAVARRFVRYNDQVVDLKGRPRNPFGKSVSLLAVGEEEKAAIINLNELRYELNADKFILPTDGDYHRLKLILEGYDYLIVLPLDQEPTPLN